MNRQITTLKYFYFIIEINWKKILTDNIFFLLNLKISVPKMLNNFNIIQKN